MTFAAVDVEVQSPLGDAVLLVDEATLTTLDDSLTRALTVALDPEGRTDITEDFPGEEWEEVWRREGTPIWDLCRAGRLLIHMLDRGRYYVRAFDASLAEAGVQVKGPVTLGQLSLHGSTLGMISAVDWIRRRKLGTSAGTYRSLQARVGEHIIEIGHAVRPQGWDGVSRTFWAPDVPAIVIGLRPGGLDRATTNVFRTRNEDLVESTAL